MRQRKARAERTVGLLGSSLVIPLVRRVSLQRIDVAVEQLAGEGAAEGRIEELAVAKLLVLDVGHRREAEIEALASFGAERLHGEMQDRIADVGVGLGKAALERGRVADDLAVL